MRIQQQAPCEELPRGKQSSAAVAACLAIIIPPLAAQEMPSDIAGLHPFIEG